MKKILKPLWNYLSFDQLRTFLKERAQYQGQPSSWSINFLDGEVRFPLFNGHMKRFFSPFMEDSEYIYEPPIFRAFEMVCRVEPKVSFLDVGANFGFFSSLVGSVGENQCVAVELDQRYFTYLRRSVSSQQNPRVHILHAGAAQEEGSLPRQNMSNVLRFGDQWKDLVNGPVRLVSLDDLVAEMDLAPNLVKVDVEGAEVGVLKGAHDLIASQKATFIIEIHPELIANQFRQDLNEIADIFSDYSIFKFSENRSQVYEVSRIDNLRGISDSNYTVICVAESRQDMIDEINNIYQVV